MRGYATVLLRPKNPAIVRKYNVSNLIYWLKISGVAGATPLAFAPYYYFWLMPCLFAALILLLESRPEVAVRSVYIYALLGYTAQFYWIHNALHDVAQLPNHYALPLTLLLPAYLALYPALCIWLWRKTSRAAAIRITVLLPVLWTLSEYLRERLFTGFGWGALGYSQIADTSPLAGYATLGGIHLVTLMCAFSGAWLAWAVLTSQRRDRFICLMLLFLVCGGGWTLRHIPFTQADGSQASVALLQGNIPQTLKWTPAAREETFNIYYRQILESRADILLLPETAIPMLRQNLQKHYPQVLTQYAAAAKRNGSALAVGIAQYTADRANYHNAVINVSAYDPDDSDDMPYYAKNHLVPFGEYKPLPALTTPLYRLMHMPLSDFAKGGKAQAPLQLGNQQVAFNICYEDGFGDELIPSAKQSSLLANVSNMGWYGHTNAMYQHLQQSQARALELGRYMVRATNNGATAIINPKGYIVAQSTPHTRTILHGSIAGYRGETPYMRMGGSLPLILILSLTAAWLFRKPPQGAKP